MVALRLQRAGMGTTKILVAVNSPGVLHRLKETLSGLEVHVAIRLRDVAKAVKQHDIALVVLCLGFDERSAVELLQSLRKEQSLGRLPVVAIACHDTQPSSRDIESRLRAAGASDFFELGSYPADLEGSAALRQRILGAARIGVSEARAKLGLPPPTRVTTMSRTLYRAALLTGSVSSLAKHLEAPEPQVLRWMQGDEEPAQNAFLAALEIVLAEIERGSGQPS
jgi:CheY-like chemotaxis protein